MTLEVCSAFRVKFNVSQSSNNSHPLHVTVSERVAEKLSIATEENNSIVALRKAGGNEEDALLVSLRIRGRGDDCIPFLGESSVDGSDGMPESPVVVWCTPRFLEHYKIDRNDTYFMKNIEVYPIRKVIFGAKNKETLKWTQDVNFGASLIVSVCQGKVLLRENDIFLAPYPKKFSENPTFNPDYYLDLQVLECVPVCQGNLTVNTEIMVILSDTVQISETIQAKEEKQHTEETPSRSNICISDFSSPLNNLNIGKGPLQNSFHKHSRTLPSQHTSGNEWMASSRGPPGFVLRPCVLPKQDLWSKMLLQVDTQVCFDPLYIIGMSKLLLLKHGLFDGSVVRVSSLESRSAPRKPVQTSEISVENEGSDVDCLTPPISCNNSLGQSDKNCDSRVKLAQVKMLNREFDSSKDVYVSPLLLFNLQPCPSSLSTPLCMFEKYSIEHCSESLSSVSASWDVKLPFAKEIQISLVNSSDYSPLSSFSEALKKYFQLPRAVCVGDVIAVKSDDDPRFYQSLSDGIETRYPVIYFKIIRIEPESTEHQTYIGDDKHTTLIQIGSVHSYIPARLESYLSKGDNLSCWEKTHLSGLENYTDTLESLILPYLCKSKVSTCDVHPCILLTGQEAVGKTTVVRCVSRKLGLQVIKVSCNTISGDTSGATEARLKNIMESAAFFSPCVLLLQRIHVLGKDSQQNLEDTRVAKGFQDLMASVLPGEFPVIVIATTAYPKLISHDIQQCFLHHVTLEVPSEFERTKMIQGLLAETRYSCDVDTMYIAQRTAGFVLGDVVALLAQVKKTAINRICKQCRVWPTESQEEAVRSAGVKVQMSDVIQALDNLQSAHSSSMGAPNIPNVSWEDIGGLTEVREEILDTIQLPLQHPELLAAGLRRSGVLLYGPPGSGKTLLAKAVATECSLNFLSVKGPELINKYVGQSEENVREVFRRAHDASPCVIFFDELDSLAPNRGRSGDSGGVMDRVVSQMLAELDGLHKSLDVFVIGATNRPDLLDPALIRPGRFDKPLYLGVSTDKSAQVKILKALTRKFTFDPDVSLEDVAEKCSLSLTGADFYALCSDAMLNALKRKIDQLKSGEIVDQESVSVRQEDFLSALSKLTPSVSEQELRHYQELRKSLTARK